MAIKVWHTEPTSDTDASAMLEVVYTVFGDADAYNVDANNNLMLGCNGNNKPVRMFHANCWHRVEAV